MNKENSKNISLSVYPLPTSNAEAQFDPGQFTSAMFIGMLFVLAPSALACEVVLDREVFVECVVIKFEYYTIVIYFYRSTRRIF